ncbi:phage tail protein [Enterobacter soli]|uniref:gp53-like domain-containing protein n=1 Tax=Enterobacter soli TaxID=885040 RepID=UPI0021473C49|nr:phage tail protein [Enterobacter soli]MCR1319950.1 phage tail protein [Enterobacter soli]
MANLPETPQWEEGIYQIEVSDPVLGGPDGISNHQGKQLASRTLYLKQQVEKGGTDLAKHIAAADPHTQYAPKASPTFTGTPTAPTPANSDNSKKLATTEFVAKALAALAGSAPETLDTLKELADALGNDPNFATTVLNKLAEKLAKDQNGADIPDPALFVKNLGLGEAAKMAAATGSLSASGWLKIPIAGGASVILQWGKVALTATLNSGAAVKGYDGVTAFNYPISFPNAALIVNATPMDSGETLVETATANGTSKTAATVRVGGVAIKSDPAATADLQGFIFAIGY